MRSIVGHFHCVGPGRPATAVASPWAPTPPPPPPLHLGFVLLQMVAQLETRAAKLEHLISSLMEAAARLGVQWETGSAGANSTGSGPLAAGVEQLSAMSTAHQMAVAAAFRPAAGPGQSTAAAHTLSGGGGSSSDSGEAHLASCTIPNCRRCVYERRLLERRRERLERQQREQQQQQYQGPQAQAMHPQQQPAPQQQPEAPAVPQPLQGPSPLQAAAQHLASSPSPPRGQQWPSQQQAPPQGQTQGPAWDPFKLDSSPARAVGGSQALSLERQRIGEVALAGGAEGAAQMGVTAAAPAQQQQQPVLQHAQLQQVVSGLQQQLTPDAFAYLQAVLNRIPLPQPAGQGLGARQQPHSVQQQWQV